jgi:glutathione synthase/RimK-type ligase-like ATP-grasp enzyme
VILVCGGLADEVTELVCARLEACGYPYRLLDLARFPDEYQFTARWTDSGPEGSIATGNWRLDLDEIAGVYARFLGPDDRPAQQGVDSDEAKALRTEADLSLMALVEDLTCPVVNRANSGLSNNSKPYQALMISRAGFRVPTTLVTSDPAAVHAFIAEHGDVIFKSASGVRSIVRRVGAGEIARLDLLRDGPAQFQAFVPGRNVRVHAVGERVFATAVESDAVDYRYAHLDGKTTRLEPIDLPPAISDACLRLARTFDLLFAGIDLKQTPSGELYCFEVNPSPGFLYYERHTGQPISTAVADLLHGSTPVNPHRRHDHG